jgi:hypothetical protein
MQDVGEQQKFWIPEKKLHAELNQIHRTGEAILARLHQFQLLSVT